MVADVINRRQPKPCAETENPPSEDDSHASPKNKASAGSSSRHGNADYMQRLFKFLGAHQTEFLNANTIECLHDGHLLQKKWELIRHTVG